jgi:hypothetical protein
MAGHPSPSLGLSPADRARWFLIDQWELPDSTIAKLADATPVIVRAARRELEAAGAIPERADQLSDDAYRPRTAADLARSALLDDATRSNVEIAAALGITPDQVGGVRRSLVDLGAILPQRVSRPSFPQHVPMPRSPHILQQGHCVGHPHPGWWTSDDPAERELAIQVCQSCHVAAPCLDWALHAVPSQDTAIYGGTTASQRRRLRAERGITRPNATAAINAAKTTCPECGLTLSGSNLITEAGRRPGSARRRCRACTRRRKHEARAAASSPSL